MRALKLACSCGATAHIFDDNAPLRVALEAAWRQTHSGEGHEETDYISAGIERVRREKERLRAQIANSKQGSN